MRSMQYVVELQAALYIYIYRLAVWFLLDVVVWIRMNEVARRFLLRDEFTPRIIGRVWFVDGHSLARMAWTSPLWLPRCESSLFGSRNKYA